MSQPKPQLNVPLIYLLAVLVAMTTAIIIGISYGPEKKYKTVTDGNTFYQGDGSVEVTYWKNGRVIGRTSSLYKAVLRYMYNADSVTIEQKQ